MPCRKCSQTGHNVRTCPQLINEEQTIPSTPTNQEITINDQSVNTESNAVEEVDECPICMENMMPCLYWFHGCANISINVNLQIPPNAF